MKLVQIGGHKGGSKIHGHMLIDDTDADLADLKWSALRSGYVHRQNASGGRIRVELAHRVIASRMAGRTLARNEYVDHANHDVRDNRRRNLRVVTGSQNGQNRKGLDRNNRSGHRGVSWDSSKRLWRAKVHHQGRTIECGRFKDLQRAADAAKSKREELGFLTEERM